MSDLDLDDVAIPGVDDGTAHLTDSCKYHGPPGTGKTTTQAAHVARIVKETDYSIADVCWLTYRKQLATETLERLAGWDVLDEDELDEPAQGATRYMGTFHAVANRSVGSLNSPATYGNKRGFCATIGFDMFDPRPWEKADGELMFEVFGWMLNNRLDPGDPHDVAQVTAPALETFNEKCRKNIPKLWQQWERYKADHDLIDFADQLGIPIERGTPTPRPILVIDEYHDAYPLMARLCEQWIDGASIVIVSGDPDQVVNNYDGADPEFFERIDLPERLLDKSHRVPTAHSTLADSLLAKAPGHEPPPVDTTEGGWITHHTTPGSFDDTKNRSDGDIGTWTVPRLDKGHPAVIAAEHGLGAGDPNAPGFGADPDDVLILARTRNQVRGINAALDACGVLHTTQSKMAGWGSTKGRSSAPPTRRRLFNALDALYGFDPDLTDCYPDTLSGWTDNTGDGYEKRTFELHPTDASVLLDSTHSDYHSQSRGDTNDIVESLEQRDNDDSVSEVELSSWVNRGFYNKYTSGADSVEELLKKTAHKGRKIEGQERQALEKALSRHAGYGPIGDGDIGVEVMTIHASKGHEGRDVILYDGITNTIEGTMRNDPAEKSNEYRTWYVGCTRSKQNLHIVEGGFSWMMDIPGRPLSRENITQTLAGENSDAKSRT